MKIVCPQCGFERQVPQERLPAASVIATCPHCQHRFRIQREMEEPQRTVLPRETYVSQAAPDEDDPLPPGAILPGRDDRKVDGEESAVPPELQKSAPADEVSGTKPDFRTPDAPFGSDRSGREDGSGEDQDLRKAATAAYEKQAGDGEAFALDNPWESPEKDGYPAAFYLTCVRVMFAAPRFFAGLQPYAPQRAALCFYLLVSLCQILIERFWGGVLSNALAPSATGDPQLQKLLEMLAPQSNILMAVLMRMAFMTMELFVVAGLYFLMLKLLAPNRANYQLIFQVVAYSAAPVMLSIVPVVGSVAGVIWSLACSFVGCRYAMGLSWPQTVLGIIPVYLLGIPFVLHLLQSVQGMMG